MDLHNIRETYKFDSLDENKVNKDPLVQFESWLEEYKVLGVKDYNAMVLSTIKNGAPDSRIVLLKELRKEGLVFYTNYGSAKGQSISSNPLVNALFFWREQERQVRICGHVKKISSSQSEKYFHSRPYLSQIGAAASDQSKPIESRDALEEKFSTFQESYPEGKPVPMPKEWGGYIIEPTSFEFWQGREGRLHDRLVYLESDTAWNIQRLQP